MTQPPTNSPAGSCKTLQSARQLSAIFLYVWTPILAVYAEPMTAAIPYNRGNCIQLYIK